MIKMISLVIIQIISIIGGVLSAINMTRTLNERKIYSSQTKNLFLNVLNYSLASNELLIYHLNTSNAPVKTMEVYVTELETMKINYQLLNSIDLTKVSIHYQKNIQGYMYHYQRYLVSVEEYLKRLKNRSDYLKEILEGKHKYESIAFTKFISGNQETLEQAKQEFLNSEYGIDYILIEDGSVLKSLFLNFLEESRSLFQDILQATESGKISQHVEIQQIFTEFFAKNLEIKKEVSS
ncbi:hypothetical protein [Enterococcus sp. C76]|uniref:hypothetical protein n=1 Tax=Enterococcus sp. C76 TaxID=3231334 RepID=UPI0034A03EEB